MAISPENYVSIQTNQIGADGGGSANEPSPGGGNPLNPVLTVNSIKPNQFGDLTIDAEDLGALTLTESSTGASASGYALPTLFVPLVTDGVTDNTPAVNAAQDKLAAAGGGTILLGGIGRAVATLTMRHDNITILGLATPRIVLGPEVAGVRPVTFVGGTQIIGVASFNGKKNVEFDRLGMDTRPLPNSAAYENGFIQGTVSSKEFLQQRIGHVSTIGRTQEQGSTHGALFNMAPGVEIQQFDCAKYAHGLALKTGGHRVNGVYCVDAQITSTIIKSDALDSNTDVNDVILTGLNFDTSGEVANAVASLRIEAVNAAYKTSNIKVFGGTSRNHRNNTTYPLVTSESGGGVIDGVEVFGFSVFNVIAGDRGFGVSTGKNITLTGCSVDGVTGFGFRGPVAEANNVQLVGCTAANCTSGALPKSDRFVKAEVNGKDWNKAQNIANAAIVPAAGVLNVDDNQYASTSGTVSSITSRFNNGDTFSLRASGGAISLQSGGNINLGSNASPLSIPDGANASFRCFISTAGVRSYLFTGKSV